MGAIGDSSLHPPTSKPLQPLRSNFLSNPSSKELWRQDSSVTQLCLSTLPRADFGPEQGHFLPQLQDLGLNIPAILGFFG